MKYILSLLLVLLVGCSDDGLVQYRDGHPVGNPADAIYESYWHKLESSGMVTRPTIQPIDREILMTQVLGRWVPDYKLSQVRLPDGEYIDVRSDGKVYNASNKEVGQWDMRKGRIDVWANGKYRYSLIKVRGRICHLMPTELYGFAPLVRVK